jgi:hypothetical protein
MDIKQAIDEELAKMAIEGHQHFAPHYVCQRIGIKDKDAPRVMEYLLSLVGSKLISYFEAECPYGHSNSIKSPSDELQECRVCGREYELDHESIWLAFDFMPQYLEKVEKQEKPKIVHIYGQEYWHTDSYIIANKEGLLALRSAIEKALATQCFETNVTVADGEGYHLHVISLNDQQKLQKLMLPYTDEVARDKRKNVIQPYDLLENKEE